MTRMSKGFSLVEMLIVMAVLSIILSIGLLSLQPILQNQKLNEVTTLVAENLKQAANEARVESRFVQVDFSTSKLTWIYASDNNIVRQEDLIHGATVSPVTSSTFTGRGLPVAARTYTVSLNGKSKNVYLLPTGAVIVR